MKLLAHAHRYCPCDLRITSKKSKLYIQGLVKLHLKNLLPDYQWWKGTVKICTVQLHSAPVLQQFTKPQQLTKNKIL